MGRRLNVPVLAAVALVVLGCHNPLLDKVMATVAQKDLLPRINLKTDSGSIPSGGSFDFGTISINTSKDVTFTIENLGTAPLDLTDTPKVSIAGTDAALFTSSDPSTPIPAGGSTTFVLTFLPTTSGSKTATLTIPNSDTTNGTYTVSLSGAGSVQAAIRVLQNDTDIPPGSSYSYPQTALAYSAPDVVFTIRNDGTATLNLTGTPPVLSSGYFIVVSQPTSTSLSAGGGTTSFVLRFTPSAEGIRTSAVTIPNDDPDRSAFSFTARGVASTVMLPKTGQTTSKSPGDDGDLKVGIALPSPRFFDNTNNRYTDNLTGLMWTLEANLGGLRTWSSALTYIDSLNTGWWRGYNDWRLPNKDELKSLIDWGQANPATWLGTQGFTGVQSNIYWASTTDGSSSSSAWALYLPDGSFGTMPKSGSCYLWPVRSTTSSSSVRLPRTGQTSGVQSGDDGYVQAGAAWPSPRFVAHGDGTVSDLLTGLRWQAGPSGTPVNWAAALDAAANFRLGGFTWRLPNLNELASLINAGQSDSSAWLNSNGFSGARANYYWTSTASAGVPDSRWMVELSLGGCMTDNKDNLNYVIFVRSEQ